MKDKDLDKIFSSLNLHEPSSEQIKKWQEAVDFQVRRRPMQNIKNLWWQWLLAGSIGFASAALFFHVPQQTVLKTIAQENSMDDATYEYVYDK